MSLNPQIKTPVILHVDVAATAESPAFSAKAMLDKDRAQYYASSLQFEHMNVKLTSARVQKTPVQKTMAPVLRTLLAEANPNLVLQHPLVRKWATGKDQRPVAQKLINSPDDVTLNGAAIVYNLAKLAGEAPIKATARAAGINRDDARFWLHLARKKNIL
ncbi:MAG TPA: hypothetical protein VFU07_05580 [Candidatus Lumbricidophila sp.]|nr:hypothetical protein [Candidatus Lumbricidophila sp.]